MLAPLLIMAVGFTLYYVAVVIVRMQSLVLERRVRALAQAAAGA
jgi:hypothetical protein